MPQRGKTPSQVARAEGHEELARLIEGYAQRKSIPADLLEVLRGMKLKDEAAADGELTPAEMAVGLVFRPPQRR